MANGNGKQAGPVGSGRLDETPVRRATDLVAPETSPGTPTGAGGQAQPGPLSFLSPIGVACRRFANRWQRMLQFSGSPVEDYGANVLPTAPLGRVGLEMMYPDELGYALAGVASGAVGNPSFVYLLNPAASGVLVIITYISGSAATGGTLALYPSLKGTGAGGGSAARDGRIGWTQNPSGAKGILAVDTTGILSDIATRIGAKVVAANALAEWGAPADGEQGFIVLAPGQALGLGTDVNNVAITGEFRWREVPLNCG